MFRRRARNIGWFRTTLALAILLSALCCAGIDLFRDHLNRIAGSQCRQDGEGDHSHMVVLQGVDGEPCNACFLQSLLGQTLLPAGPVAIKLQQCLNRTDAPQGPELAAYKVDNVTRGPPLA